MTIIIITSKQGESKPKPVISYQPRAPLVSCLPSGLSVGCPWAAQGGPPVRRVREELRWASSFWFISGPGPRPSKDKLLLGAQQRQITLGVHVGRTSTHVPRLAEGPFSTAPGFFLHPRRALQPLTYPYQPPTGATRVRAGLTQNTSAQSKFEFFFRISDIIGRVVNSLSHMRVGKGTPLGGAQGHSKSTHFRHRHPFFSTHDARFNP